MKKCSYCAEEIQDEAIKCKHCGEMLDKTRPTGQTATETLEEKTLKEDKPALRSYAGILFIAFFLLIFFGVPALLGAFSLKGVVTVVGIGLLFIVVVIIHRNSIRYTITNKRIKTKKGVIVTKVDEIDIDHIRNVSLRQDLSAKIMKYGDVLIGTAGTAGYEVILEKISHPQETMTLIKDLQSHIK